MSELKLCPFCGGEAQYHRKPVPKIRCSFCHAQIVGSKFKIIPKNYEEYLSGLWNGRYPNENPKT